MKTIEKIKVPKPTLEQYRKVLSGEIIELIPAKKGFCIYLYPDMQYFKYISLN